MRDACTRYRMSWYAAARRILVDPAEAEDCVQEALLAAWRHRHQLRDPAAVGSWVRVIVTRSALQRRAGRRSTVAISDEQADSQTLESVVLLRFEAAQAIALVEALPPRQRKAVLARLIDQTEYSALARSMSCSEATARSLVRHGLTRVRQQAPVGG